MTLSTRELIELVETYFRRVDAGEVDSVVALMSHDVVFEVVTHGVRHEGREAVRAMFRRRLETYANGWHGNFRHLADAEQGWVTSRFDVVCNHRDGQRDTMNNINFFEFDGPLMRRISVWFANPVTSLA
jgi:ketosteroid isomerase-like protein